MWRFRSVGSCRLALLCLLLWFPEVGRTAGEDRTSEDHERLYEKRSDPTQLFIDIVSYFSEPGDELLNETALYARDLELALNVSEDTNLSMYGKVFELDFWHMRKMLPPSGMLSTQKKTTDDLQMILQMDARISNLEFAEAVSRPPRRQYRDARQAARQVGKTNRLAFNDPHYHDQWYFQSKDGKHLNVIKAWRMGYTGKGVKVCIVDDGLDHTHEDLKFNYMPDLSFDFNDMDDEFHDPFPSDVSSDRVSHGTKCAGAIGARANNEICGVGIAFESTISGFRLLDGPVTYVMEARAITYLNHKIDIKSMSWGPPDNGQVMERMDPLMRRALDVGVNKGRQGKGVVYVFAAGNGGEYDDHGGADEYASNPYCVSVNAIDAQGLPVVYSEKGSAVMCAAYVPGSRLDSPNEMGVVTTSVSGKCELNFGGTSAAAPLVSGAIALMLQANPTLTYRDVMHIIAYTSRITSPADPHFNWYRNAAGYHIHEYTGFGAIDAGAMVEQALKWVNVGRKLNCSQFEKDQTIFERDEDMYVESATIPIRIEKCSHMDFIEHVRLRMSVEHTRRGNIKLVLRSPQGTPSVLLDFRKYDRSRQGIRGFAFTTVRNWGENPQGVWNLTLYIKADDQHKFFSSSVFNVYDFDISGISTTDHPEQSLVRGKRKHVSEVGKMTADDIEETYYLERATVDDQVIAEEMNFMANLKMF